MFDYFFQTTKLEGRKKKLCILQETNQSLKYISISQGSQEKKT